MVQPIPLRHILSSSTTHLPAFAINARNMEVVGPYIRSLKGPGYKKVSKSGNSEEPTYTILLRGPNKGV